MKQILGWVVLVAAMGGFSSCVATKGDLLDMRASFEARDAKIDEALDDLEAGVISETELRDRITAANGQVYDSINGKVDEISGRVQQIVAGAAGSPITGNPMIDLGLTALGSVIGGFGLTQHVRNKQRQARGELVTTDPRAVAAARGSPVPPVTAPVG